MFKEKRYFFLAICIFLVLVVFFSDGGISSSEISSDAKENEQNSPLNNGEKFKGGKIKDKEQEKLNNLEILITPFVLGFGIFWAIISYFYRIISVCLYPAFYVLQTFYNIFIYKPYTVIRWILSALFPVYLFCMVAAVLGCFVGGASGWLSEVIVTFLNQSSSLSQNININNKINNINNDGTGMIVDEDNMNDDNYYYENINNDDNENNDINVNDNDNDNYHRVRNNNNDHYESNINYNNNNYYDYDDDNNNDANSYYDDDRNSNYNNDTNIGYGNFNYGNNGNFYEEGNININNNNGGIDYNYNDDYNNNIDEETQRMIQEEERKKCEKLRKRITALAEIKARNGGKLPDDIIARYRKVRGESYSGYNSSVGGG